MECIQLLSLLERVFFCAPHSRERDGERIAKEWDNWMLRNKDGKRNEDLKTDIVTVREKNEVDVQLKGDGVQDRLHANLAISG